MIINYRDGHTEEVDAQDYKDFINKILCRELDEEERRVGEASQDFLSHLAQNKILDDSHMAQFDMGLCSLIEEDGHGETLSKLVEIVRWGKFNLAGKALKKKILSGKYKSAKIENDLHNQMLNAYANSQNGEDPNFWIAIIDQELNRNHYYAVSAYYGLELCDFAKASKYLPALKSLFERHNIPGFKTVLWGFRVRELENHAIVCNACNNPIGDAGFYSATSKNAYDSDKCASADTVKTTALEDLKDLYKDEKLIQPWMTKV